MQYCKHCYKIMEGGIDICPACGKSQQEKGRKIPSKPMCIVLGIATWFGTMLAIAAVGTALDLQVTDGIFSKLYSLCVVVVPVLVAFKVASPAKNKQPVATTPKAEKCSPATQEKVDAVVAALRNATIAELYGEDAIDSNDEENVVKE